MLKHARRALKSFLDRYPRWLCKREFEAQAFTRFNERPVELAFLFRVLGQVYPRTVLDVGTGATALPHLLRNCGFLVTATDNIRDYWPTGMVNRHYHVLDDDITDTRLESEYELITCISVLEHIQKADDAVRNIFSLLKTKGHLVLTCPYTEHEYVWNVYDLPGSSYGQDAPYITQSYSRRDVVRWLRENDGILVEQELWQFWEGEHWTVGRQIVPPRRVRASQRHQLACMLIRKR